MSADELRAYNPLIPKGASWPVRRAATWRASCPFTDAEVAAFRKPGAQVVVGFDHPEYSHMAVMPDAVRQALGEDFD